MKRILLTALAAVAAFAISINAQIVNPIVWTISTSMTSATEGEISFAAAIEPGWHLYGTNLPDGGPRATTVTYSRRDGIYLPEGEYLKGLILYIE